MASPLAERPERLRAALQSAVRFAPVGARAVRRTVRRVLARARRAERACRIDAEALAARSPRRFEHGPGADDATAGAVPTSAARRAAKTRPPEGGGRAAAARRRTRRCRRRTSQRSRASGSAPRPLELAERLRARDAGAAHAARARAAARRGGSTCARRSGSASRMAASRSTSSSAGASSSRCASSCCSTPPARWSPTSRSSPASCTPSRRSFRAVRGVPVSYPARACLLGAERARSGARARPARADGGRRRRRHQDRRVPGGVQSRGTRKRVIHSRTCVMILSDGYDTGAPELLAVGDAATCGGAASGSSGSIR